MPVQVRVKAGVTVGVRVAGLGIVVGRVDEQGKSGTVLGGAA